MLRLITILRLQKFYNDNLLKVSGGENLGIVGPVYMTCWERTLVCLIMFPIGKDKALNAKMRRAFEGWVKLAAERGWAEYRAPAAFQDLVSHCGGCAKRSRTPWIPTAFSRPGGMACGRNI